jgi:hypothetical protein
MFGARIPMTSFFNTYEKINERGECELGYKNCGDKSTVSKGHCIPASISVCPLTDITLSAASGYSRSLPLVGFTLFFNSQEGKNPISDLMFVQDHACFIRGHYPLASGRKKYKLLKGDYQNCRKDDSVTLLNEMGETDFFDINQVEYQRLTEYGASNNYKYKMAFGKVIEWSPDCKEIVPSLRSKPNDLNALNKQYTILFIIYIISFCVSCLVFIGYLYYSFDNRQPRYIYKALYIVRLCFFLLVLPSLCICTIKLKQFENYFNNITNLKCSNDIGNENFRLIATDIDSRVDRKNEVMISLSIVGMAIEMFLWFFYLKWIAQD